jgi:hypothetical protein
MADRIGKLSITMNQMVFEPPAHKEDCLTIQIFMAQQHSIPESG